ncbi:MAG: hypothetical protein ACR2GK_05885 [Gemmatimonadaceae bacterium]
MSRLARFATSAGILAVLTACASAGGPATDIDPGGQASVPPTEWPIRTQHHVDLWLHGFAMISDDTTLVPYFRRGYKAEMNDLRRRANVSTQLDANMTRLRERFAVRSDLVNAQFVAQYFNNLDEMSRALDIFQRADGNPRAAGDRETAELIALLAGYFPLPADRDWARLYLQSISDENTRFYRSYWDQQQRERAPVVTEVTSQWQSTWKPRFQLFLNNTQQSGGEILLSLPLNGEGRTLTSGRTQNSVAVGFPARSADAREAIYVVVHEIVGQITATAVRDNVTPNDARLGLADRYIAVGAVRAGAMLIQKVAPELLDGYARYYLAAANRPAGTNPVTSMTQVYSLPVGIRDAISRQIDVVLGGI